MAVFVAQRLIISLAVIFDSNRRDKQIWMVSSAFCFVVQLASELRPLFVRVTERELLVELHERGFEFLDNFLKCEFIQVDTTTAA